jgi:hypothetical protein
MRRTQAQIREHTDSLRRAIQLFTTAHAKYVGDVRIHARALCGACGFQWDSGRTTFRSSGKNMANAALDVVNTGFDMLRYPSRHAALALAHAISNFERARLRAHDKASKPRLMSSTVVMSTRTQRDMRAGAQGEPDVPRRVSGIPHTALDWSVSPTIGRNPAHGVVFKHEQTAAVLIEMMRKDPSLRARLLRAQANR